MFPIISQYTPPSTTNIADGLINSASDVVQLVESSGGVNDRLSEVTNNGLRTFTNVDDDEALEQNVDVNVYGDATSGAFNIFLPPLSGQYKPIFLQKDDATYNGFTFTCDGSDKIEDPTNPLLTPTAPSFTIKTPKQSCVLMPYNGAWRFSMLSNPLATFTATLGTPSVSVGGTEAKLIFNVVPTGGNIGGYYDNITGAWTPQIAGKADIVASVYFSSGSSAELIVMLKKNGTTIAQSNKTDAGNSTIVVTAPNVEFNGTTDKVEIFIRAIGATRNILNDPIVTRFHGVLTRYR